MKWINENLCTWDEKVRIERGPPLVKLACTDEALDDRVTHPNYKIGGRDALGELIRPDESDDPRVKNALRRDISHGRKPIKKGDDMHVLHWQKPSMWVWKVYEWQEDEFGNGRFIKTDEIEGKEAAVAAAEKLAKGGK